jgi:hypothetical protein
MKCQRCQFDNEAGAKFCGQCGAVLAVPVPAVAQPTPPVSQNRCPRCGTVNNATNVFCEHCGTALALAEPAVAQPAAPVSQIPCPRCGTVNNTANIFCEHCGTNLSTAAQSFTSSAASNTVPVKKVPGWWWLMPIFLGWLGGVIAWLVVKESDRKTAMTLLWVGIGLSVFWAIVSIVLAIVLNAIS